MIMMLITMCPSPYNIVHVFTEQCQRPCSTSSQWTQMMFTSWLSIDLFSSCWDGHDGCMKLFVSYHSDCALGTVLMIDLS